MSGARPIFFALFFSIALAALAAQAAALSVTIYQSESCGHCRPYLDKAANALKALGASVVEKEIVNVPENRAELARLQESFGVPLTMQGHLVINVDDKYLFEGHVPVWLIEDFLKNSAAKYSRVVVTQDTMSEDAPTYLLLSGSEIKECLAADSIEACDSGKALKTTPVQPAGGVAGRGGVGLVEWLVVILIVAVPVVLVIKYGLKSKG